METERHPIGEILRNHATSFFIPPFQRSYAWGKPEIERFYNDLQRIIDSELDPEQTDKLEHFFGTIVIKVEKAGFESKFIIVDGQQRLTTTLLFLIALRDLEEDQNIRTKIENSYLVNPSSSNKDKITLKQVTKDAEAYEALVKNGSSKPGNYETLVNKDSPKLGNIIRAHNQLRELIKETKKNKPNIKTEHFITGIERMNVAVIFLDERPFKGEDPQIIFETLNSLGKPLTLSDLVRNYVLFVMKSDKQTEIYEKIWYPEIENIFEQETSKFLRDYLQYKMSIPLKVANENNTKELYQKFKDYIDEKYKKNVDDFINDIVRYAKLYKQIISVNNSNNISEIKDNDKSIKELLRNIFQDIKSEPFKPFVLGLLEYHQYGVNGVKIDDDRLIEILETIRTYLIRRRVLGLTTSENKNIPLLCKEIEKIARKEYSMIKLLTGMTYSLRLPNDNDIEKALTEINFYHGLKQYAKFILRKIEEHNSKATVDLTDSEITIEHIMPQTKNLSEDWKMELGENWKDIHEKCLHNIGNLILTEFNKEMGASSFDEKKKSLQKSNLNYRLDVLNKEKWNEESIREHQENMINWFLETFPLPDDYKKNNNWNNQKKETEWLSPLDLDAENMAEGSKPTVLKIDDNDFDVKSWRDVLISFLKYIRESSQDDFGLIVDNQRELFGTDDAILKLNDLLGKAGDNGELLNMYKTIDGKTLSTLLKEKEDLKEDKWVIQVHMSTSNCISRMANIMNKLSMDEDRVKIKLNSQSDNIT